MKKFSGFILVLLGLSTAVVSGAISVSFAKESGWWIVAAYLAAEIGEFVLPIAGGFYKWTIQLRVTMAVCTVISAFSIGSYLLNDQASVILSHQANNEVSKEANEEIEQANLTLKSFAGKMIGSVSDLEKMVVAMEKNVSSMEAADSKKMGYEACFKKCQAAKAELLKIQTELSSAKARDHAEMILNNAKQMKSDHQENASGLALIVKTFFGINTHNTEVTVMLFRSFTALLLLKLMVYLTIPGLSLMGINGNGKSTKAKVAKAVKEGSKIEKKSTKARRKQIAPRALEVIDVDVPLSIEAPKKKRGRGRPKKEMALDVSNIF